MIDPAKRRHIYYFLVWFYGSRPFFAYCCLGFETFLIVLFVRTLYVHVILDVLTIVLLPSFICKNLVHIAQFLSSVDDIAKWDHKNKSHEEYPLAEPCLCFGI